MREPQSTNEKRHVTVTGVTPAPDGQSKPVGRVRRSKARERGKIKILFLAATPVDGPPLQLDKEVEIIKEKLSQAEFRGLFDVVHHSAVRVGELQALFLKHKPTIIHFSGHGSRSSQIILHDDGGRSHTVSPRALSQLFSILPGDIRCVVLNACYSETQALAIAEHIECVIGMSSAIRDQSAISFAGSFYQALGFGQSVKTAFELACNEIDLRNLGEEDTPRLLALHASPEEIVFADSDKLARALVTGSDRKRLEVVGELIRTPQKYLTTLLIQRSTCDPSPTVRHWLNLALGKIGSRAAIDTLWRNIEDADAFASLGAQDALKELGNEIDSTRHSGSSG
jgi:hypothetical protein